MRARLFRPRWLSDPRLGVLSGDHFRLFVGITGIADREGRLYDVPPSIHGEVFPHRRDVNVDKLLTDLRKARCVVRYKVGKYRYLQIVGWHTDQNVYKKEPQSIIPAPRSKTATTRARKSHSRGAEKLGPDPAYSLSESLSKSECRQAGEDPGDKSKQEEMDKASADVRRRAREPAGGRNA